MSANERACIAFAERNSQSSRSLARLLTACLSIESARIREHNCRAHTMLRMQTACSNVQATAHKPASERVSTHATGRLRRRRRRPCALYSTQVRANTLHALKRLARTTCAIERGGVAARGTCCSRCRVAMAPSGLVVGARPDRSAGWLLPGHNHIDRTTTTTTEKMALAHDKPQ